MTEEWPSYRQGRRDHIDALGVIASAHSAFIPSPLVTPPELTLSRHPKHGAMPDYLKNRKR